MGEQLFLERFVWFDGQVRRGRYPNATKLSKNFEISTKTAQRSIEFFRDRLQAPLEYSKLEKGYRYTNPKFELPVSRLSESELLALLISKKLITEASAGSLADDLEKISKRLGAIMAENLPGGAHPEDTFSFRFKTFSPTDPVIFKNATVSLLSGRLLTFCYFSPTSRQCTMRTVEPHHMVNYMGNWHLIAYCRLRNDWRDFLLGRMTLCQVMDDDFVRRPNVQWQPFLTQTFGIFQNRKSFEVTLKFTPERAAWIKGVLWHESQTEEVLEDGSLILKIPASHEAEIMMEVLKHGSQVEVVGPEWLREKVVGEITEALQRYR